MNLSKQAILTIGVNICISLFFFNWIRTLFFLEQADLCSIATYSFQEAIEKEKKTKLSNVLQYTEYTPCHSPNEISFEEKANWCDQDYLTEHDSTRATLDSLFQKELIKQNIYAQTAVSCLVKGETVYSHSNNLFFQKSTPLSPVVYRISDNPEERLELRAYVLFSLWDTLKQIHFLGPIIFIWLLSLSSVNLYFFLWKKRRKRLLATETEITDKRIITPIKTTIEWKLLPNDLLFDEKNGILQYLSKQITLSGNGLKLFSLFVNRKNNFLSYEEICKKILSRKVDELTQSDKDAVFTTIRRLRKDLESISSIEIKLSRGKGYQLVFHESVNRL